MHRITVARSAPEKDPKHSVAKAIAASFVGMVRLKRSKEVGVFAGLEELKLVLLADGGYRCVYDRAKRIKQFQQITPV